MKYLALVLLLPVFAVAQQPPFDPSRMPSQADMQKMMQQAQKMQTCMAGIDEAELRVLQQKAEAISGDIERLCKEGKDDEALDRALEMKAEMDANETVQQMRKCSEGMADLMPQFDMGDFEPDESDGDDSICSGF